MNGSDHSINSDNRYDMKITKTLYPLANTEILAPELVGDHSKMLA